MGIESPFGQKTISVEKARKLVTVGLGMTQAERVELSEALGRVSAFMVNALVTSPPVDVSSMDGYAVRAADVASPNIELPLSGVSRAGTDAVPTLHPMTCMRIFTGAPVPLNADAIIIQEDTAASGDSVRFLVAASEGAHIREAGLNFSPGRRVLKDGHTITARDIGLLAASGHKTVYVRRRPRIAVLSTGDELTEDLGEARALGVLDANRPALMAVIRAFGAIPVDLGIARDDDAAIAAALADLDVDMLVVSGGASVGDHDRVRPLLLSLGLKFSFWKIRMRPGKSLMFGQLGETPVLGMPGNPVSALVCALLFLKPAIATLLGAAGSEPIFENARLTTPIAKTGERDDYLRATLTVRGGDLFVEPHRQQDSAMFAVLSESNALLVRPAGAAAANAGDTVKIIRFDTSGSASMVSTIGRPLGGAASAGNKEI